MGTKKGILNQKLKDGWNVVGEGVEMYLGGSVKIRKNQRRQVQGLVKHNFIKKKKDRMVEAPR